MDEPLKEIPVCGLSDSAISNSLRFLREKNIRRHPPDCLPPDLSCRETDYSFYFPLKITRPQLLFWFKNEQIKFVFDKNVFSEYCHTANDSRLPY